MSAPYDRLDTMQAAVERFAKRRRWLHLHKPVSLAMAVDIEAAELLELFLWGGEPDAMDVAAELADVVIFCAHLANSMGISLEAAVSAKMSVNEQRKPLPSGRFE